MHSHEGHDQLDGRFYFKSDAQKFELFERETSRCVASCISSEAVIAAWRLLDPAHWSLLDQSHYITLRRGQ